MAPEKELILRNYLRRKIAEKNTEFAKMSSKFKDPAKIFRIEVFTSFARGKNGSNAATPSNLNLMSVREHINRYCTGVSPYNYFDLDTLIAYDAYWDKIFLEAERFKNEDVRDFYNISDFEKAKYVTSKFFIDNEGTVQTGYYDLNCPVRILRNENRRPIFESTPKFATFNKQYSYNYCEELLEDYMLEKHAPKQSDVEIEQEPIVTEEESHKEIVAEECDFLYCGEPYIIDYVEYYLDSDFNPIKRIIANSVDNSAMLIGCFNSRMEPYYGELFDMDYMEVQNINSGVSVRYCMEQFDDD